MGFYFSGGNTTAAAPTGNAPAARLTPTLRRPTQTVRVSRMTTDTENWTIKVRVLANSKLVPNKKGGYRCMVDLIDVLAADDDKNEEKIRLIGFYTRAPIAARLEVGKTYFISGCIIQRADAAFKLDHTLEVVLNDNSKIIDGE